MRVEPHVAMHSDAADVSYRGTLGLEMGEGLPGLWEGRSFWKADDRAQSITLRELKAFRLLLHRHFAAYLSSPCVCRILLHDDNQAVVYILNATVSASKEMMAGLQRLEGLLRVLGVRLEARWIRSAVNRFADTLSRKWNPGDVRATTKFVRSIQAEYVLDHVVFQDRPLGEGMVARRKYLSTHMGEYWGDGKERLWNPPFDLLPVVVRKIAAECERGVSLAPNWKARAWYARLRALASGIHFLQLEAAASLLVGKGEKANAWSMIVAQIR